MAFQAIKELHNKVFGFTDLLISPIFLLIRLYIANVFFKAGLTKIRDWESTLLLYEYEYEVPVLSYEVAAWLATAGELILPVLLVIGLFSRITAIGLFFINAVAVISLVDMPAAAFNEHVIWGVLILSVILLGAQKFSLDRKLNIS